MEQPASLGEDAHVGRATGPGFGEEREVAVVDTAPVIRGIDRLAAPRLLIGVAREPGPVQPEESLHEPRAVESLLGCPSPEIRKSQELRGVLDDRPPARREALGEPVRGHRVAARDPARGAVGKHDFEEAATRLAGLDDRALDEVRHRGRVRGGLPHRAGAPRGDDEPPGRRAPRVEPLAEIVEVARVPTDDRRAVDPGDVAVPGLDLEPVPARPENERLLPEDHLRDELRRMARLGA